MMNSWQEKRFHIYLSDVEKNLKHLRVEDRVDLLQELSKNLKNKLNMCETRDSFQRILNSQGSAYDMACRLTARKELPLPKKRKTPFLLKFLLMATLLSVLFFSTLAYFIYHQFSMPFSFDTNSIGSYVWNYNVGSDYMRKGVESVEGYQFLDVTSTRGRWRVLFEDRKNLSYECSFEEVHGALSKIFLEKRKKDGKLVLSLPVGEYTTDCELQVPLGISFKINLQEGEVLLFEPVQNVEAYLEYGQLKVTPKGGVSYLPYVQVKKGSVEGLEKVKKGKGHRLNLTVDQGQIIFE